MSSSSAEPLTHEGSPQRPSRRAVALVVALSLLVPAGLLAWVLLSDDDSPEAVTDAPASGLGPVAAPGKAEVGEAAPGFTLPSLDGGSEIRLDDYRGRPLVLTFWASWCTPCRREFPLLQDAYEREAGDLEVLGVTFRDLAGDAQAFREEVGATFPAAEDERGEVASEYGVRAIPQTFFVDSDGVIRDRVFGIASEEELAEPLAELLDSPAG